MPNLHPFSMGCSLVWFAHISLGFVAVLMRLIPNNVRVLRDGAVVEVRVGDVRVGDIVDVKARGRIIPVDGVVVKDWGYVDE
jgi:cation transport ATPase